MLRVCAPALALAFCVPAFAQMVLPSSTLAGAHIHPGTRAMLYWQLSLSGTQPQAAQYGLRFESTSLHVGSQSRSVPLFDLGHGGGRTTVKTFGGLAFDSSDPSDSTELLKKPLFWIGAGAALVGISCATGNFPCKHHDHGSGSGTYTAPGATR
jgi:hypothetical protein